MVTKECDITLSSPIVNGTVGIPLFGAVNLGGLRRSRRKTVVSIVMGDPSNPGQAQFNFCMECPVMCSWLLGDYSVDLSVTCVQCLRIVHVLLVLCPVACR